MDADRRSALEIATCAETKANLDTIHARWRRSEAPLSTTGRWMLFERFSILD